MFNCIHFHSQFFCEYSAQRLLVEAGMLGITKLCLERISQFLTPHPHPAVLFYTRKLIVLAPLLEGMFFWGLLRGSLYFLQKRNVSLVKQQQSEIFRVRVIALLFALGHLSNERGIETKFFQFSATYIQGLAYGYLTERYQLLLPGIAAHAFINSFEILRRNYSLTSNQAAVAATVNGLIIYLFSTGRIHFSNLLRR